MACTATWKLSIAARLIEEEGSTVVLFDYDATQVPVLADITASRPIDAS